MREIEVQGELIRLREKLRSGAAQKTVRDAGLTCADVGRICGVSNVTAWHWMTGYIKRPYREHSLRLLRLLEQLEVINRAS